MKELPDSINAYNRTPDFNESTVPAGLLKAHNTKQGVWAKIVILEGELRYTINEPENEVLTLNVDTHGVVEPTIRHEVKPIGKVRFYVEFYR